MMFLKKHNGLFRETSACFLCAVNECVTKGMLIVFIGL